MIIADKNKPLVFDTSEEDRAAEIARDEDIAEIKEKVNEIHAFLMEFAAQMEAMGNNPMVKALVGGMLPKIGKRNGNSRG